MNSRCIAQLYMELTSISCQSVILAMQTASDHRYHIRALLYGRDYTPDFFHMLIIGKLTEPRSCFFVDSGVPHSDKLR